MKLKSYKSITLLTLIFSLLLFIPISAASASPNVDSLMKDAKNKGTVLKWAISIEGSGDGKTRPWKQYNDAKDAYHKALSAINQSNVANKEDLIETLDKDAYLHIERTMHYIDAITAGEKINDKKAELQKFIGKSEITNDLETAYHSLSAEIRKQGVLLDRVYGQSTRDLIRQQFKYSAEDVLNSVKYSVTVKMKLDELETLLKTGNSQIGTSLYKEIVGLIAYVEKETFKVQLNGDLEQLAVQYNLKDLGVDTPVKVELTMPQIKEVLTTEAIKRNIPPEILKGVALTENGSLKQFNDDGTPLISFDGGIGIMQVTLSDTDTKYDKERLKYDTRYNIQAGADILLEKWNYGGKRIPTVNGNEMDILENWYFAIMAYNGLLSRNDPNTSPTTYQGRVYNNILKYTAVEIANPLGDILIAYDATGKQLFTDKMIYETNKKTKSTQQYKTGDIVKLTTGGNFRQQPNTSGSKETLAAGTEVEIVDGTYEDDRFLNLFTWYKVKVVGTNKVGYMASSNLQ